jgi:uncharacterized protein YdhG (YjbR/CyaY superfamily)
MSQVNEYIASVPEDKQTHFVQLRNVIVQNLPSGFDECISYGTIGYVVPHSMYPKGYHCNTALPLPLINIAAKKNFIVLHHIGLYMHPPLLDWFMGEYPKYTASKLDMGKGCVRFKKTNEIPYELIALLVQKLSVNDWVTLYEKNIKISRNK